MSIPLWKKYLSYFFEMHIESAPSAYNPHLYVSLSKGRFQLCTANAIYSYEDLYDNFGKTFNKIDFSKVSQDKALILGFGLGSVPFILEKKWQVQFHYTAVEIDESVLYLANKYALEQLMSPIQMIAADAHAFVLQCQEQFDLIVMDVFLDDLIPSEFQATDFVAQLKRLLTPNGLLLFNRLANRPADLRQSQLFYDDVFKPIFPKGTYIDVGGNWILLNNKAFLK